jgi:hypothetical protein
MDEFSIERFEHLVLEWARAAFAEEVRSSFQRAQGFDAFQTQRLLTILRERSQAELQLLARVLPLQVFNLSADCLERRRQLPAEEREVVERFRADLDRDRREHFSQGVAVLDRMNKRETKQEFNVACRQGEQIVKEIAVQRSCVAASAARGEWGLIFEVTDLKIVLCLKLARWMELGYSISINSTAPVFRHLFRSEYLADLGIGGGSWNIPSSNEFPHKLQKACEFALWHLGEYRKLIEVRA